MADTKLTIAHSVALSNVISKILYAEDAMTERVLPFSVKYKLQRNADILLKDCSYFEYERAMLFNRLGKADGDKITIGEDSIEEYNREIIKLTSMPVTHDIIKLKIDEVESIDSSVSLNCHEMNIFVAFLVEDDALRKTLESTEEEGKECCSGSECCCGKHKEEE